MYKATQFAELNSANVARAAKLAGIAIENAEKLAQLNASAARTAIAQGMQRAAAAGGVKAVEEFFALPAGYAEADLQSAVGYSRSLYQLSTQAQSAYAAVAEEALAGYTRQLTAWVEKAGASAPVGSEAAVTAFKSSVAASRAAYERWQEASKQVATLAGASIRAATESATKVATAGKGRKAA